MATVGDISDPLPSNQYIADPIRLRGSENLLGWTDGLWAGPIMRPNTPLRGPRSWVSVHQTPGLGAPLHGAWVRHPRARSLALGRQSPLLESARWRALRRTAQGCSCWR